MTHLYESLYSESGDITFIMDYTYQDDDLVSAEVVGFYCGEPNEELTTEYMGKTKATY